DRGKTQCPAAGWVTICPASCIAAAKFARSVAFAAFYSTEYGTAMKPEGHPDYHTIKVIMTDGSEFTTLTTWGKPGDTLHLDIDPKSQPGWPGGQQQLVDRGGRVSRFQKKFAGNGIKK